MVTEMPQPPARASHQRRVHHRHSLQSTALALASRFIVKNTVRAWAARPNFQWPFESVDSLAGLLPQRGPARIEQISLDNCSAEWVQATDTPAPRAILYLHGGAFLTCGLNTHRSLVSRLSRTADAHVLNVNYRMLPSHGISDAIDDALSGLRWLRRRGFAAGNIVVAGDSAGGYLAFMTALAAIRSRLARPAGIAAVSPFTDADPTAKLTHRNANRCAMFPCEALSIFADYLQQAQVRDERETVTGEVASPVDADLSSLPPVTIHASADELLLPDAETMAQRLDEAHVRCDLHLWEGQIHDFPLAADVLPEGRRALRYIGDFVKEVTKAPPDEAPPDSDRAA